MLQTDLHSWRGMVELGVTAGILTDRRLARTTHRTEQIMVTMEQRPIHRSGAVSLVFKCIRRDLDTWNFDRMLVTQRGNQLSL